MKYIFAFLCLLATTISTAQTDADKAAVIGVIKTVFDGMRAGDSATVRSAFLPDAQLLRTYNDKEGMPQIGVGSIEKWLESIGTPREATLDEKIWTYDVRIDQNLATVWTDFTFYLGDRLSHCGVNAFQLFRTPGGWKIFQVVDTHRTQGCITPETDLAGELNDFIDSWHEAAATADAEGFFGRMAPDGVYIGTDASERWLRDELRSWAKDAFERDSAWDFKASDRHLTITDDQQLAWWDEKLDTWMGTCRGSGVLERSGDGWKIKHYQLAVTVPNEKIQQFIELVK